MKQTKQCAGYNQECDTQIPVGATSGLCSRCYARKNYADHHGKGRKRTAPPPPQHGNGHVKGANEDMRLIIDCPHCGRTGELGSLRMMIQARPAGFRSDTTRERASHDAELRRISMALGIPWPTSIEGHHHRDPREATMKHPLKWQANKGLLAEALSISPEDARQIEEKVEAALAYHRSMKQLFQEVGEMDISDELWANFLYTYGWWDGRRQQ